MGFEAILPYVAIGYGIFALACFWAVGGGKPRAHWSDFDPARMRRRTVYTEAEGRKI